MLARSRAGIRAGSKSGRSDYNSKKGALVSLDLFSKEAGEFDLLPTLSVVIFIERVCQ